MTKQPRYVVRHPLNWIPRSLIMCIAIVSTTPSTTLSSGFHSPDECLAYSDEAHLNCLYAYIEIQQDKIIQLETQLNNEKRTAQQLQEEVQHHLSLNDILQQRISDRKDKIDTYRHPRIRMYSGFSYGFGRPRYYRRFFQPHLGFHMGPYYPDW